LEPDQPDALHLCGVTCYQLENTEEAERLIRAAIRLQPDNPDYHSNLGLVMKAKGNLQDAIESFKSALAIDADFTDCLNNLGNTYLEIGKPANAEEIFRRLLEKDPNNAQVCNSLAVLFAGKNANDSARDLWEHVLRLDPSYAHAHFNYGRMLLRLEQYDAAIDHLQSAAQLNQSSAESWQKLGDALQKTGRLPEAMAACKRALSIAPDDSDSYVSIGNVYQCQGQMIDAEIYYRRALEFQPGNARAINNLGTIFMSDGDTDKALERFGAAVDQEADFAEAIFNMGSALHTLGEHEQAIERFLAALAIKPGIQKAYQYLAEIYRVSGMPNKQQDILREWLKHFPESPTALHLFASLGQAEMPARASDDFIREEFDDFADGFEKTLGCLEYQTPGLIGVVLERELPPGTGQLAGLDAGCGTGLCGPHMRPFCSSLTGVDLSQKMLDQAAGRELYDELLAHEIVGFMNANPSRFDLVISADTLVYFGPLEEFIAAAAMTLRPGGRIAFSVEHLAGTAAEEIRLNASGRYSHSQEYVSRCLQNAGFVIDALEHGPIRSEMSQPVGGLILLAHTAADRRQRA
jgi:predicted TPR repeat methyltransferase